MNYSNKEKAIWLNDWRLSGIEPLVRERVSIRERERILTAYIQKLDKRGNQAVFRGSSVKPGTIEGLTAGSTNTRNTN